MERKIIVGGSTAYRTLINKLGFVSRGKQINGAYFLEKDKDQILFIHVPAFDNLQLFPKLTAGGVPTTSHLMVDIGEAVEQILK